MKSILFILIVKLLLSLNAIAKTTVHSEYLILRKKQLTHDFYIRQVERPFSISKTSNAASSVDCISRIKKNICLAENSDSPCVTSTEIPIDKVITIYQQLPIFFQKGFCALTQIRIEKNMSSTAYATADVDENWQPIGGIIGINLAALNSEKDFSTWISWKEQLNFGGSQIPGTLTPGLPRIEAHAQVQNTLLTYVIIHELSHIFDMANQVQQSWGPEFWEDQVTPKQQFNLPARSRFCYYRCNGEFITPTDAIAIYKEIESSIFPNSYSMMSSLEDFAEVSTLYFWKQYPGATYKIHTNENSTYDVLGKLSSAVMKWKVDFVKSFYLDQNTKHAIGQQIKPMRKMSSLTL